MLNSIDDCGWRARENRFMTILLAEWLSVKLVDYQK